MCWQQTIYNKLMRAFICFLIIMLFFSCTEEVPYFQEYQPPVNYFNISDTSKISVIQFFKEVALGAEYGNSADVTQKWDSAMHIFVGGTPDEELLSELKLIKNEINELATDGFSIDIVHDSLKSNFYLFFGSPQDYVALFPEQLKYIDVNNFGLFYIDMVNFVIRSGHMYVNSNLEDHKLKKHILREELTQSLGLPKDLPYDVGIIFENCNFIGETFINAIKKSIFYEGMSSSNKYNWADKLIIRLLYHPQMSAGLDDDRVDGVLMGILGLSSVKLEC
jgi:hypothetical protein